jgi:hypothetical protein
MVALCSNVENSGAIATPKTTFFRKKTSLSPLLGLRNAFHCGVILWFIRHFTR